MDDPYYDKIPVNNKKTKFKKISKKVPDNLTINDLTILSDFKRKAYRYDMAFNFIGVPFGTSAIVQLLPFVGIILTTYQSLQLVYMTRRLTNGLPPDLIVFFIFNIVVDLLLGLIPIVGDLITISYKSNTRNYAILRKYLDNVSSYNSKEITLKDLRSNWFNNFFNWRKDDFSIKER